MAELQLLRTLTAVVEIGSVHGAARQCGYSASAVSRQLAKLQRQLGVKLFEPEGRGIRPSPLAERLVERASDLLAEANAIEIYLHSLRADSESVWPRASSPER